MDNTNGEANSAFGCLALENNTGNYNTGFGYKAGDTIAGGYNNLCLGYNAQPTSSSTNNEITLGNASVNKFRVPGTELESSAGVLDIKNSGTASEMRLYCESNNAHYAALKSPAHSAFSGNLTFTIPSAYGTNGQILQSNGSGGTSWTTPAGGTTYTASSGLTLSGTAFSVAYGGSSSNEVRKITTSTSAPSGGSDGDIWIKYT